MSTGRRRFLRWTLGGAAGALLTGSARELGAAPQAAGDPWLDALAIRKHKAFLDVGYFGLDGGAFRRTKALLATLHENYGASDKEIGVAFGAHSSGLGYLVTPATWDELGLGELIAAANLRMVDAQAIRGSSRNWGTLGAENVAELQQRGVRFLACRQTIGRWADKIATGRGVAPTEIATRLTAGLHPGVEPVPAMVTAAVMAQARRLAYVSLA